MLTVEKIYKKYEGKPLLSGVTFNVDLGEIVCLLGPSGSGKSTLLRIIAGLEQAEAGKVYWEGNDFDNTPPHQRHFGLMFQDYALFPHRTVFQNIAFGLRMQGLEKDVIREKTLQALRAIRMQDFADRQVTDLSGGEQQRVALARALAPNPRLLMLDEPLGALDHNLREQLLQELRHILRETQIPAIYVTHDQEEAFAIADRLLVLQGGKIVQNGTAKEIYLHPASTWVADFFGLGNLVRGVLDKVSPPIVKTALGKFHLNQKCNETNVGDNCTILLRPEDALLRNNIDTKNCIQGTVTDCIFQGQEYRLELLTSEGSEIMINTPMAFDIGSIVIAQFPPEKILCLQKTERAAERL